MFSHEVLDGHDTFSSLVARDTFDVCGRVDAPCSSSSRVGLWRFAANGRVMLSNPLQGERTQTPVATLVCADDSFCVWRDHLCSLSSL